MPHKKTPAYKKIIELTNKIPKRKIVKRDVEHCYLALGCKVAPRTNKDSYTIDVIKGILSRGQSSRLFNEIRTKHGLAYQVGAYYEANIDFGFFAVYLDTSQESLEKARNIVLEQFKLKDLTKKELNDAKSYIEGNFILTNEDNKERADFNASMFLVNQNPKNYLRNIRKVTLKDIKRIVKKYFNGNCTEVVIMNKKNKKA